MNREWRTGHDGKVPYYSKKEAIHVMKRKNHGMKMRMYACTVDGRLHWHLTTMSKAEFKLGRNRKKTGMKAGVYIKRRPIAGHELEGITGQIKGDVGDF